MHLSFLGTGEATDEINYNTSFIVSAKQANILFDCGYAIPNRFWKKYPHSDFLDIIYFSHTHADHAFGFPALLLRMFSDQRTKPLQIICPRGCREELLEICRLGYEFLIEMLPFKVNFVEVEPEGELFLADMRWRFARTLHPRKNLAVRVDNPNGQSLAYSGDGDITRSARELYWEVGCLVHDAYSFEPLEEIHTQIDDTIVLAKEQRVKKLFLTHLKRKDRNSKQFKDLVEQIHEKVEILAPLPGQEFDIYTHFANHSTQ